MRLFLPLTRSNRAHLGTVDRRGLRERSAGGDARVLVEPGHVNEETVGIMQPACQV